MKKASFSPPLHFFLPFSFKELEFLFLFLSLSRACFNARNNARLIVSLLGSLPFLTSSKEEKKHENLAKGLLRRKQKKKKEETKKRHSKNHF